MTRDEELKGTKSAIVDVVDAKKAKKPMLHVGAEHKWQICFDCDQTGMVGDEECNMCAGSGWIPI